MSSMRPVKQKVSFYDWTPELITAYIYKSDDSHFLYAPLTTYNWFSQFIDEEKFDLIEWNALMLPIEKTIFRPLSNQADFTPSFENIDLSNFDFSNEHVISDIIQIFSFLYYMNNILHSNNQKSFLDIYNEAKTTYHFKSLKSETKFYIANFCASHLASTEERYAIISSLE